MKLHLGVHKVAGSWGQIIIAMGPRVQNLDSIFPNSVVDDPAKINILINLSG